MRNLHLIEIDNVMEVQSVLPQIIIKPKLKTDTLPITMNLIILPKFNYLPLQSINIAYFGTFIILNKPIAKVKYKVY